MVLKRLSPFLTTVAWSKAIENVSGNSGTPRACADPEMSCVHDCQTSGQNCIIGCASDVTCISQCSRNEAQCVSECPCPTNNSILLLSTYNRRNKPMVINPTGDLNDDLDFEYDGAEAHNGCAATLMGEFWYFGGGTGSTDANQHKRQMSKVEGCKLKRQAEDMDFDFWLGACQVFNDPEPVVLLCFHFSDTKACHTFDGEKFGRAGSTKVSHKETLGLANYKGRALTTGCSTAGSCGVRTESMDMTTLKWSDEADYPYGGVWYEYIYEYTTASTPDAAYIIGGGPLFMDTIAEFKNDSWSKYGKLHRGRQAHGVITVGAITFVIGGMTEFNMPAETEAWDLGEHSMDMITPELTSYEFGLGLWVVPSDFCKK